ncbi:MAG: FKBP-type peptidyl-prolyl cis-trans isomerase [Chitinophagales bacterium]|nr:FKBP-type peptidyl-prolyl cis-trans isomerase [Chitinophagaceae bacterium]MCB9065599.1 FKBP-type peptidyl-prolyl cis-trans isomerase [Chitinophagales bacterium]
MKKVLIALLATVGMSACVMFKKSTKDSSNKSTIKETNTEAKMQSPSKTMNAAQEGGSGFIQMEGGLEYRIVKHGEGTAHPDFGDYIELHLSTYVDDSMIFETRSAMQGEPAPVQLQKPPYNGDMMMALRKLKAGDSAVVHVDIDSLVKAGVPKMDWMKLGVGQKMEYRIQMVSVKTQEHKQQEEAAAAEKQVVIDDDMIKTYMKDNKITGAQKTASGLYYTIDRQGKGAKPEVGDQVTVNYTGKLLNGEVFDSNVDPAFNHVQPFQFFLGKGMVIKGWDEGVALLDQGTKATLYIPSGMAYGKSSPSPKIPANSVMIFDVELLEITKQSND